MDLFVTKLEPSRQYILLLEKFLRGARTLCMALRAARNSPVHSNGVINYAIAVRLFLTVLCDCLKIKNNVPDTIVCLNLNLNVLTS